MTKSTVPKSLAYRIATQRTAWEKSSASKLALENLNKEIEAKLAECDTDKSPSADIATMAKQRAEKTAFRMEYTSLAEAARKEAEQEAKDDDEAARAEMRKNTSAPLNTAVQAVREIRVQRRTAAISAGLLKWATGFDCAAVALAPSLNRILHKHLHRNGGNGIPEREVIFAPGDNGDARELLCLLAEQDPSVHEIDALPVLGGINDRVSEAEFEAVAEFLETLPANDAEALTK